MFEVNNKFDVGEECWTYARVPIKSKCPVCEGKGYIIYKDYQLRCAYCCGSGQIHQAHQTVQKAFPFQVTSIKASLNADGKVTVRYKGYSLDNSKSINNRRENTLFKTYEEAEKAADEINKGNVVGEF